MAKKEEEKMEMMSPEQQFVFDQVVAFTKSLSDQNEGVQIFPTGKVEVEKDADDEMLRKLVRQLAACENISEKQGNLVELALAGLINDIAGRSDKSIDEIVDELQIDKYTEKSIKTIRNWCRAEMALKPGDYHYGLTITHYCTATGFAGPEDPSDMKKFVKGRSHLLTEAAEDPIARGKSFISEGMKRLQEKFGVDKKNKTEKLGDVTVRLIDMLRIAREGGVLEMIVADEGQRKDLMNHVNDQIESDIATLSEKGKLNPVIDEIIMDTVAQAPPELSIVAIPREITDGSDSPDDAGEATPEGDDPLEAVDPVSGDNPDSSRDEDDESDWTDEDYVDALAEVGHGVNDDGEGSFSVQNTETGAETQLDAENYTDALFEAWGLVKP